MGYLGGETGRRTRARPVTARGSLKIKLKKSIISLYYLNILGVSFGVGVSYSEADPVAKYMSASGAKLRVLVVFRGSKGIFVQKGEIKKINN